ncbi:MAG: HAD family hydrolase [Chthonomonadetes bacterium]|nr:HAD family hydrolase [Chthonomonadetes bacterium]
MRFLPGTHIEIIHDDIERGHIRFALFDFDGTLSLIREGWQQVMVPMMVEVLQRETSTDESPEELTRIVREYVDRLTGKQTVYQMIQLCEEIKKRGGKPRDPLEYKWEYLARLWERIKHRVEGLKNGSIHPDEMLVPGSRDLLENLKRRGVRMYLASGTDEVYVLDEAAALRIDGYFDGIYGAIDDYKRFSKALVIQHIIQTHSLSGRELVAFGDGFVEIENTKAVGGIAVGVASDEVRKEGINEWKRNRLIGAGADIIVPEFREQEKLVAYLWNEPLEQE